jgi:hypothetical protein
LTSPRGGKYIASVGKRGASSRKSTWHLQK